MATKKAESPDNGNSTSSGPFWVKDGKGNEFVWPFVADGLQDTGESPYDQFGNVRANKPVVNPANIEGTAP